MTLIKSQSLRNFLQKKNFRSGNNFHRSRSLRQNLNIMLNYLYFSKYSKLFQATLDFIP